VGDRIANIFTKLGLENRAVASQAFRLRLTEC